MTRDQEAAPRNERGAGRENRKAGGSQRGLLGKRPECSLPPPASHTQYRGAARCIVALLTAGVLVGGGLRARGEAAGQAGEGEQIPPGAWTKLSPLPAGPVSPRLGYEGACAWDPHQQVLIRYGGHNQGGGGEQHAEVWTFDPKTARWSLKEPNTSPPGICCGQQNLFDPVRGRYLRFPSFSGSHGWQWWREIYLNDASVWSYDLKANVWRNMRPLPAPTPRPLRCASWDLEQQVAVVFGGEGSRDGTLLYDPQVNAWSTMNPAFQPAFRSGGNMAYDPGQRHHLLFGSQFTDDPHTWAYDLRRNAWTDLRPAVMPPTDRNDAVLAFDPGGRRVLAVVKIGEGEGDSARSRLETWRYLAEANRWERAPTLREPDPSGNRARVLAAAPEQGLVLLENRTHPPYGPAEQQVWAYRAPGDPRAAPGVPAPLPRLETSRRQVLIRWDPPAGETRDYAIERSEGEPHWTALWNRVGTTPAGRGAWRDGTAAPAIRYRYRLRPLIREVVAGTAVEKPTEAGPVAVAQPEVVEDGYVNVVSPRQIEVAWTPLPARDVAGYVVERAPVEVLTDDQLKRLRARTPPLGQPSVGAITRIGRFRRLTPQTVSEPRFLDNTADLDGVVRVEGEVTHERRFPAEQLEPDGKPYRWGIYAYRVRAVNQLGIEGGPSPAFFTIPTAPMGFFAREQGTACELRWQANPEQSLQGYRIYRLDGRFDNEPLPRLTRRPVAATSFRDPIAGDVTRRYYVVAVDALGQEGFPSSPVWFRREWQEFYKPFVGEWHQ